MTNKIFPAPFRNLWPPLLPRGRCQNHPASDHELFIQTRRIILDPFIGLSCCVLSFPFFPFSYTSVKTGVDPTYHVIWHPTCLVSCVIIERSSSTHTLAAKIVTQKLMPLADMVRSSRYSLCTIGPLSFSRTDTTDYGCSSFFSISGFVLIPCGRLSRFLNELLIVH